jgi:hypothetical protein
LLTHCRLAIGVLLLMSAVANAGAQVEGGPAAPTGSEMMTRDEQGRVTLRATRVSTPIRIDGRLDEELYQSTRSITGFVQTEPNRGELATEQTEV